MANESNAEARLAIVEEIAALLIDVDGVNDAKDLSPEQKTELSNIWLDVAGEIANILNLEIVAVDERTGTVTANINAVATSDQIAQMKADPSLSLDDLMDAIEDDGAEES